MRGGILNDGNRNLHDLGREAAHRLLAQLDGVHEVGTIRLPCTLVVRESCGARAALTVPVRSVVPDSC